MWICANIMAAAYVFVIAGAAADLSAQHPLTSTSTSRHLFVGVVSSTATTPQDDALRQLFQQLAEFLRSPDHSFLYDSVDYHPIGYRTPCGLLGSGAMVSVS